MEEEAARRRVRCLTWVVDVIESGACSWRMASRLGLGRGWQFVGNMRRVLSPFSTTDHSRPFCSALLYSALFPLPISVDDDSNDPKRTFHEFSPYLTFPLIQPTPTNGFLESHTPRRRRRRKGTSFSETLKHLRPLISSFTPDRARLSGQHPLISSSILLFISPSLLQFTLNCFVGE